MQSIQKSIIHTEHGWTTRESLGILTIITSKISGSVIKSQDNESHYTHYNDKTENLSFYLIIETCSKSYEYAKLRKLRNL